MLLVVVISASLLGGDSDFRSRGPLVLQFAMRALSCSFWSAVSAIEARPAVRRAFLAAALVPGADRLPARVCADARAAMAVLTPFSTGLGGQSVIARKAAL